MKLSRNKWPLILMSLALLAVFVFGVIAYLNTGAVRAAEQEITLGHKVCAATERMLSTVYGAESFHRGYLVTGEQEYLDQLNTLVEQIDKSLTDLRELVREQPEQLERIDGLDELVKLKKKVLAEAIESQAKDPTARKGLERVHDIVLNSKGENLREFYSQILAQNDVRLTAAEQAANQRAGLTEEMVILGNTLAIGLSILAMIAWRKSSNQLESALVQQEATASELNAIVQSATEGIITFGTDLNFRFLNPAAENIRQVKKSDVLGTPILDMVPERLRAAVHEKITDYVNSSEKQIEVLGGVALRSDGSEFPYKGTVTRSTVDGEEVFTQILTDLSDQKELQSMTEQQRKLFDQIQTPIHICDMEDKVVFWNRESERVFGISAKGAVGSDVIPLIYAAHTDSYMELKEKLLDQNQQVAEWQLTDKDGKQIVVEHRRSLLRDWAGKPSAQLMLDVDITGRKQTEIRIQRSQRLESIGTLAGGVAHDMNNVLSPILIAAKMLKRDGADYHRLSDTIGISAERAGKMVRKLLVFAGGESSTHEPLIIGEVVKETESILAHALPNNIELTITCDENLYSIKGDATEISQVLMNLAINARDAMPDGGQLDVRVNNSEVNATRAARSQVLEVGRYVCLTVSDSGEGIPPEVIDKIFDPFFTTKPQDKGTGLGLATTMGIIRSHNGEIFAYSELGHGTTFTIFLPAYEVSGATKVIEKVQDVTKGDGQTILLVDDESLILETARDALELNDYKVITASGGAEAVSNYQHHRDTIDVVILDVMMPGMDGLQTRDALRAINPHVKVIATSGLRKPGSDGSRMKDVNGFLPKPYSDEQLFKLVAKVIRQT